MYISATTWLWSSYWKRVWNTLSLIACTETSLCRKWKSLWMNCKYKLQFLEGMVYSKSSLTFLFIQTYSFVGLYKTEKKRKKKKTEREKEKRKKVHFYGTPLRDCLLDLYEGHKIVKLFAKALEIKRKRRVEILAPLLGSLVMGNRRRVNTFGFEDRN